MELTVSRPVKILLLVLVLAGVAGIASMSVLGKSSDSAATGPEQLSVAQIRARAHKATGAATPAKAHPRKTQATATTTTPAATTPKPAVTPAVKPKPRPTVAANGLPILLADALRQHRVVVVSVFDPQSQTDAVSYAEARAGAADARAGFLGVSVLDDTVAGPLTAALPGGGLLPVPGILVYRSGQLIQRVDGFADRDSVAQLAVSARTAQPLTPPVAAPTTTPAATAPVVAPPTDSSAP